MWSHFPIAVPYLKKGFYSVSGVLGKEKGVRIRTILNAGGHYQADK